MSDHAASLPFDPSRPLLSNRPASVASWLAACTVALLLILLLPNAGRVFYRSLAPLHFSPLRSQLAQVCLASVTRRNQVLQVAALHGLAFLSVSSPYF